MQSLTFWKTITMDNVNLLEKFLQFLAEERVRFCVIGGQAVNAYVDPLVSLDLDLAVIVDSFEILERKLRERFVVKKFPHSLNISLPGSELRIQIQTDERYAAFVMHATEREVLGVRLPVAPLADVLTGEIWAAQDPQRQGSKRQKDLADIARLIEAYPELRSQVPAEILRRLE